MTTNAYGQGRVTYVGTVPDRALSRSLAEWLTATSLPADEWRNRAPSVTCTAATAGDGSVLRFVHNWSWERAEFRLPGAVRDLISGAAFDAGEPLRLGPWDVRVVVERRNVATD